MGQKRKEPEPDGMESVHESRQSQIYGSNPKPPKKVRKSETAKFKKQAHVSSVNAIKKQIRDVARQLAKGEDMPANIRLEHERALAAYQQELASAEVEKIRQKMIKKYHKVRFFERQKATRLVKKLRRRILECTSTEEVENLEKQMHIAEVDLNYTQYFPLAETYISLYPQKDSEESRPDDEIRFDTNSKPPMWKEVEKCMEDGTLDQLRNRKPDVQIRPVKLPQLKALEAKEKARAAVTAEDIAGLNRRQRRALIFGKNKQDKIKAKHKSMGFLENQAFGSSQAMQHNSKDGNQDDGGNDGGFFEE